MTPRTGDSPAEWKEAREFLRFAHVSLLERLARIRGVIRKAEIDAPVTLTNREIFGKLYKRVEMLLDEALDGGLAGIGRDDLDFAALYTLHELVMSLHNEIPRLHESAVRWLSGPWTDPYVTEATLLAVEESLGQAALTSLRTLSPIVSQSGVYDFLDDLHGDAAGDPGADRDTRIVTWAMPAAEVSNPLAWPILFHEVAHAIVQVRDASSEEGGLVRTAMSDMGILVQKPFDIMLSQFVTELLVDRIAAAIGGPAYFSALTSFGMLWRGAELFREWTNGATVRVRPSVMHRVRSVAEYLESNCRLAFTNRGASDMAPARWMSSLFSGRKRIENQGEWPSSREGGPPEWLPKSNFLTEIVDRSFEVLSEEFGSWQGYSAHNMEVANGLANRLSGPDPLPVPSLKSNEASADGQALGPEQPNRALDILNAAWAAETRHYHQERWEIVQGIESGKPYGEAVQAVTAQLGTRDALVLRSMEIMLIHRDLLMGRALHERRDRTVIKGGDHSATPIQ